MSNMLPVIQTAMQYFGLSRRRSDNGDDTSGQHIYEQVLQLMQPIFLDTDQNGDYRLIKPSDHLYTITHDRDIQHLFEENQYPSVIMENAERFTEQFVSDKVNSFSSQIFPDLPEIDNAHSQQDDDDELQMEDLFEDNDELYRTEEDPSDDS